MNNGLYGFPPQKSSYRVYTALLKQFNTDAPIATILENTLGFIPTWVYDSSGVYKMWGSAVNTSLQFSTGKTFAIMSPTFNTGLNGSGLYSSIYVEFDYQNNMINYATIRSIYGDGYLYDTPIEIRIYP